MEDKDPIEDKFRETFADFEEEPPARVWDNLGNILHPVPGNPGFWSRIADTLLVNGLHPVFYLTFSGVAICLVIALSWLGSGHHCVIRGHAYAGESRLTRGIAGLFQVADKVMPWDSVTQCRTELVDRHGHFQFSGIGKGLYILRVAPEEGSEQAEKFQPTWFDRSQNQDSCRLITVSGKDINAEVHLMAK